LVGSNNSQTRYRILKIDRTDPNEINVIDDKVCAIYSRGLSLQSKCLIHIFNSY